MRLDQRVVVITGAGRGIGRACALRAAADGADLVLADVGTQIGGVPYPLATPRQLEVTAERCRAHGAAVVTLAADVRQTADVSALAKTAMDRFGRIDVVINNAGIGAPAGKATHRYSEAEWSLMLDVNLTGAWRVIQACVPAMERQRSGSIINISSTAGLVGYRHFAAYVASKHGLIGLTKSAALDYAPSNVRVNALCPGPVRDDPGMDGEMTRAVAGSLGIALAEQEALDLGSVAMNSVVDPADVADAAIWLASDESGRVTGTTLAVDAGYSAR